jgi:hypothetical protein
MMTRPLTLCLPLQTFESLHDAVDGRGKFCKVSKRDLAILLADHSRVLAKLTDMKVETEEGYN